VAIPLQLTEEDLQNPDVLGQKLITLAEIVVRKHFYASWKDKDDLVSVGVLKALNLISSQGWTKSRGSFVNYIYSGMRNDMHNYLYHQNKFNIVDYENLPETGNDDRYFEDEGCEIELSLIHSVCMRFTESFGDAIEYEVIHKMKSLGFNIKGMVEPESSHTLMCCTNILREEYGKSTEEDMIGRIIGLILWKKKEHDGG
jgi:hypothetical protein